MARSGFSMLQNAAVPELVSGAVREALLRKDAVIEYATPPARKLTKGRSI